jgi:hypothetical protein
MVKDATMKNIRKNKARSKTFAPVNKNWLNYPIARDARTRAIWRQLESGNWITKIPGESRIKLIFHHNARRRLVTGFDMAILFGLLALAYMSKSNKIEINKAKLLEFVGLSTTVHNVYQKVNQTLDLWQDVSIVHRTWYEAGFKQGKKYRPGRSRTKKILPPPIVEIRGNVIELDDEWIRQDNRYFERVRFPIPIQAAHQNLILWLLAARPHPGPDMEGFKEAKTKADLYHIIGARGNARDRTLMQAIRKAVQWWPITGQRLEAHPVEDMMMFHMEKIEAPAPRIRQPEAKPEEAIERRRLTRPSRQKVATDDDDDMWRNGRRLKEVRETDI